jgi:hypothetical protein
MFPPSAFATRCFMALLNEGGAPASPGFAYLPKTRSKSRKRRNRTLNAIQKASRKRNRR